MIEALQQHATTMHLMIDEMRAQRDDMRTFMDGVLDVLKNMTVTREIIRETVQFQPPQADFEAVPKLVGHGTVLGHTSPRPKTAADKVREHLTEHPEDRALPVRDLADKIGVGKSTVQRVLAE